MTIGKNIKLHRKAKKLTQVELAEKSNKSRSYIADLELGRYNPSVNTLKSIAAALGVDTGVLINTVSGVDTDVVVEDKKMIRIDEARKILGDDYVIVPVTSWNDLVEELNKLKSKLEMAEKELQYIKS